jgi:hypothetical protein
LAKHIPMEKIILNTTVDNIKKGEA